MEKNKRPNKVMNVLSNERIDMVGGARVDEALRHIKHLHRDYDGQITLAIKTKNKDFREWSQYHFNIEELEKVIGKFLNEDNLYVSSNGFWTSRRRIQDIRHLKALWQDIDYYNIENLEGKSPKEIIEKMKKDGKFKGIGLPSFYIYSGNGMYLFWIIESAPKQMLPLWQMCQNELYERFKEYGADPQSIDAPHVLRVCGSKNGKTGNIAEMIIDSPKVFKFQQEEDIKTYNLQHFIDALLPKFEDYHSKDERKEFWKEVKNEKKANKKAKENKGHKKIKSLFNLHTLHFDRLQDLESLVEIRNEEGIKDGYRELVIFLYRYWSCCYIRNKEQALQDALRINNTFIHPLSKAEVVEATESAESAYDLWLDTLNEYYKKGLNEKYNTYQTNQFFYKKHCCVYSNKTLIQKLNITDDEMRKGNFKTIISTKVKNERSRNYRNEWLKEYRKEKRRNENGLTSREQEYENKLQHTKELLEKDLKKTEIAEMVGVSRRMIYKYIDDLREREERENAPIEQNNNRIDASDVAMIIAI